VREMILYHILGFFAGFVLDLILGDPYWLPHPVRAIGKLIAKLEAGLLRKKDGTAKTQEEERKAGRILVITVLTLTGGISFLILCIAYTLHPALGIVTESIMSYQVLAAKCLKQESMKVYARLKEKDLPGARKAVSMIVGRDTDILDETGVAKAAIETVAENLSDGVIAPMLYLAVFGPVLGLLYKAVNTMDSMVGYKNEKYLHFGRAAAKLDDGVNYVPARISAVLMIAAAFLAGKDFNERRALMIYKRDRYKHASPNSAQTEAVLAGALGIRIAGDASYFGKTIEKPYIGDEVRAVEYEDIVRANKLLYISAALCQGICLLLMLGAYYI
jgi:adenosylcobinamide-phosphate synthase